MPAVAVLALGLALAGAGAVELRSPPSATATTLSAPLPPRPAAPPTAAAALPSAPVPPADPGGVVYSAALPVSVLLPGRREAARVVPIGVRPTHDLDLPDDVRTVGWWSGGPAPAAAAGRAVLAGHLDSAQQGPGVFAALLDVALGDEIVVTDSDQATHRYVVTGRRTYPKARLPAQLFSGDGTAGLTLITCGGPYDSRTHHYRDNVVVSADPVA